eukprot:349604-Chlamydomonas_euryale.AAC.10
MYIPCAESLVRGGYFLRHEQTGGYDTLTSAQSLLRDLVEAHARALAALPVLPAPNAPKVDAGDAEERVGDGGRGTEQSLLDVAKAGLATDTDVRAFMHACGRACVRSGSGLLCFLRFCLQQVDVPMPACGRGCVSIMV